MTSQYAHWSFCLLISVNLTQLIYNQSFIMKYLFMRGRFLSRRTFTMQMLLFFFATTLAMGCKKADKGDVAPEPEPEPVEERAIYKPREFQQMDFESAESTWSFARSKQSTHFIVFWGKGYGENDPNSQAVPAQYRVDIDDLLAKAEEFYDLNINQLKFATKGSTNLDKYKMMIFLHYTTDWMAYGGGYDDVIGALWVSPNTCQPVGSTIAHEIGHSFQYQIRCDQGNGYGFRYGFGGNGGNGFWEQTAQWQANQIYTNEIFNSHHFTVYAENYHRHQIHEHYRYANYFIHYYWADKHGKEMISRVWRETRQPDDPLQGYMKINGINSEKLNDEIYDMASKFATWDIPSLRNLGANYIGRHAYKFEPLGGKTYRVHYDFAPGTTGYNVVPLAVPAAGTVVSTAFEGIPNATGYNQVNASLAGWRYGYVAMLENGTRVYGDMHKESTGNASFTVPANTKHLFFVVTGAPTTYSAHAWDENLANDAQWPYKVTFNNTSIKGYVDFEEGQEPQDITLTVNAKIPFSDTNYEYVTVSVDASQIAQAFVQQASAVSDMITAKTIEFVAIEPSGAHVSRYTANGFGHWFDGSGNVINWGAEARFYSEFNEKTFTFNVGLYPGQVQKGDKTTLQQALVYKVGDKTYIAKVVINAEVI